MGKGHPPPPIRLQYDTFAHTMQKEKKWDNLLHIQQSRSSVTLQYYTIYIIYYKGYEESFGHIKFRMVFLILHDTLSDNQIKREWRQNSQTLKKVRPK